MYIQTNIAFQSMTGLGPSAWNRDNHSLSTDITHRYHMGHQTKHSHAAGQKPLPFSQSPPFQV